MEPIISLKAIAKLANAAARQGVPLADANPCPAHSAASHEFHAVYTLAYAEQCLDAA